MFQLARYFFFYIFQSYASEVKKRKKKETNYIF